MSFSLLSAKTIPVYRKVNAKSKRTPAKYIAGYAQLPIGLKKKDLKNNI